MLKHIFVYTALALAITACSKTEKPAEKTTPASAPTTQTASVPAVASVASETASTPQAVASQPSDMPKVSNEPMLAPKAEQKPVANAPAISAEKAVSKSNEKPAENVGLQKDLTKLFATIDDIDSKHQAKQAELEKQMQSASTPEEQKKVFDEIIKQLDVQKQTLTELKFDDKRVSQVRDKMLKNIAETRSGMEVMAKNPEATPQSHPEIAKTMQQAEKTALDVRENIQKLVQEADMDSTKAQ